MFSNKHIYYNTYMINVFSIYSVIITITHKGLKYTQMIKLIVSVLYSCHTE